MVPMVREELYLFFSLREMRKILVVKKRRGIGELLEKKT
jgi:hypothetical protein